MQLYIATVKPVLSFSSPLQSDTLFGAFCWNYKYCYGEEALLRILEEVRLGKPSVIFSNAFPQGTLPLPLGIRDSARNFEEIEEKAERKKAYQDNKKIKNARYVRRASFLKIINGDCHGFTKDGLSDDGVTEQSTLHNMVSRDMGIVRNIDNAGNLYESQENFTPEEQRFDIYILSSLEQDVMEKVLSMMFSLGIGKDKSTGKGAFILESFRESEPFQVQRKPNAYIALSNFIPAASDPTEGHYKTMVKFGKLDREYASREVPFKKPLMFIQAGAVFRTEEVKAYYGRCVEQVSVYDNIVTSAYTIAVPACLE